MTSANSPDNISGSVVKNTPKSQITITVDGVAITICHFFTGRHELVEIYSDFLERKLNNSA